METKQPETKFLAGESYFVKYLFKEFQCMLSNSKLVDLSIVCEGKILVAHKIFLAAASPIFKKIIESNPCKHPVVVLQDVEYQVMKHILTFIYRGEIKCPTKLLPKISKTAQTLQIPGLSNCHVIEKNEIPAVIQIPVPVVQAWNSTPEANTVTPVGPIFTDIIDDGDDSSQTNTNTLSNDNTESVDDSPANDKEETSSLQQMLEKSVDDSPRCLKEIESNSVVTIDVDPKKLWKKGSKRKQTVITYPPAKKLPSPMPLKIIETKSLAADFEDEIDDSNKTDSGNQQDKSNSPPAFESLIDREITKALSDNGSSSAQSPIVLDDNPEDSLRSFKDYLKKQNVDIPATSVVASHCSTSSSYTTGTTVLSLDCPFCFEPMISLMDLHIHVLAKHIQSNSYMCKHCKKLFTDKILWFRHVRRLHRMSDSSAIQILQLIKDMVKVQNAIDESTNDTADEEEQQQQQTTAPRQEAEASTSGTAAEETNKADDGNEENKDEDDSNEVTQESSNPIDQQSNDNANDSDNDNDREEEDCIIINKEVETIEIN